MTMMRRKRIDYNFDIGLKVIISSDKDKINFLSLSLFLVNDEPRTSSGTWGSKKHMNRKIYIF